MQHDGARHGRQSAASRAAPQDRPHTLGVDRCRPRFRRHAPIAWPAPRRRQKMPSSSPAGERRRRGRGSAAGRAARSSCGPGSAAGVWACVHTISVGATGFRRQPVAIRSSWRAALLPSLPAQISAPYGRPLMLLERGVVAAIEEVLHHAGDRGQVLRRREQIAVGRKQVIRAGLARRAAAAPAAPRPASARAPSAAACAIWRVPSVIE